ncbi:MAG: trypsin-like serine protease [Alphaproteobacteria bacterium]|nr:MAG: trypsin-like serine protease [Alphaproteobacteria bacterium]
MRMTILPGLLAVILIANMSEAVVRRDDVEGSKYLAKPDEFPPLATFYVDGAHGTLVKPKWIVTAAHATFCVTPESLVLVNGTPRKVKALYVNPDYTPGQSHDIALVELEEPVADVVPAAIYTNTDEYGQEVWFIGIGGTGTGLTGQTVDNAENKGVLRKAQNKIVYSEGTLIKFVFDQGEAALPLEGVSGAGDSGGAAFVENENGFSVLGISSRPEGEFKAFGEYGIIEVYTRISYFKDWISLIINGDETTRAKNATSALKELPAGVTEDILPYVCNDIGIKEG